MPCAFSFAGLACFSKAAKPNAWLLLTPLQNVNNLLGGVVENPLISQKLKSKDPTQ